MSEDDLGLSGPVVAVFESYWPAKSQVISDVSAIIPAEEKYPENLYSNYAMSSLTQEIYIYLSFFLSLLLPLLPPSFFTTD